jgi:chromosome segregation ATPase
MPDCLYHIDHENRIKSLEYKNESLDDRITITEKNFAIFDIEYRNAIVKLPETLESLKNTMVEMQVKLNQNCEQINSLEKKINDITDDIEGVKKEVDIVDEKSKIDFLDVIKNNIWKILTGVAILYIAYINL